MNFNNIKIFLKKIIESTLIVFLIMSPLIFFISFLFFVILPRNDNHTKQRCEQYELCIKNNTVEECVVMVNVDIKTCLEIRERK